MANLIFIDVVLVQIRTTFKDLYTFKQAQRCLQIVYALANREEKNSMNIYSLQKRLVFYCNGKIRNFVNGLCILIPEPLNIHKFIPEQIKQFAMINCPFQRLVPTTNTGYHNVLNVYIKPRRTWYVRYVFILYALMACFQMLQTSPQTS